MKQQIKREIDDNNHYEPNIKKEFKVEVRRETKYRFYLDTHMNKETKTQIKQQILTNNYIIK